MASPKLVNNRSNDNQLDLSLASSGGTTSKNALRKYKSVLENNFLQPNSNTAATVRANKNIPESANVNGAISLTASKKNTKATRNGSAKATGSSSGL